MRLNLKRYPGYAVEVDQESHSLLISDDSGKIVLAVSADDLLDRLIEQRSGPRLDRRSLRIPIALHLKYTDIKGKSRDGLTATISSGGIFLESYSPYPVGSTFDFDIRLPYQPGDPIYASGEVVWTRVREEHLVKFPGMGIKFNKIGSEDQLRLLELVDMMMKAREAGYS